MDTRRTAAQIGPPFFVFDTSGQLDPKLSAHNEIPQ